MMRTSETFTAQVQPFGETALLVSVEAASTDRANNIVMALNAEIVRAAIKGVVSTTPSYDSLLIQFEHKVVSASILKKRVTESVNRIDPMVSSVGRNWVLPACFEGNSVMDREHLEAELSLDWKTIVDQFCSVAYRVNAIGFLPGFTYLGNLPTALHCSRMDSPRQRIPASSIAMAGNQAGIYPLDSPGGWRIVGQLPFPILRISKREFTLFNPNDRIVFEPVSETTFRDLLSQSIDTIVTSV
jgi:inhibitor of KinA